MGDRTLPRPNHTLPIARVSCTRLRFGTIPYPPQNPRIQGEAPAPPSDADFFGVMSQEPESCHLHDHPFGDHLRSVTWPRHMRSKI